MFGETMSPLAIAVVGALGLLLLFTALERLLAPTLARRAVARILKKKDGDPRALENPKWGTLSEDGERLKVNKGEGSMELPWNEVEEVHAFKRDLFTTDLICLAFKRAGMNEYLEIHEEMAGYHDLLQTLPSRLPGFSVGWFFDVAFPAFETNHRTIWKRTSN
jgi:hypothetical protein